MKLPREENPQINKWRKNIYVVCIELNADDQNKPLANKSKQKIIFQQTYVINFD